MGTLPTLQVLLDNGTGSFPHDITSKVLFGPGYSFSRGRGDWQEAVTAGELSLTLNNSDGRFTPGSTIIASPSPITVDQRIRLKETINGITYNRFTGYVKSWPVDWPATVPTFATVQITATDAQARAERWPLGDVAAAEIALDSPTRTYVMNVPSTAAGVGDTSGNQGAALTQRGSGTAVTFDGVQASFSNGKYLSSGEALVVGGVSILVKFSTTATTTATLIGKGDLVPAQAWLAINSSGQVGTNLGTTGASSGSYNDGAEHVAEITVSVGGSVVVYVDGTSVATATGASASSATELAVGVGFTGTISQVVRFDAVTSAARAAAHASALLDGFAGESETARLTRLAGYAGLPLGTLDASLTNLAGVTDTTGRTVWEAIQAAVDASGGLAYVDGSGNLVFLNRDDAPGKVTPDLTLASTYIIPGAQPVRDDQQIVNYLEVTAEGTGITQVVRDAISESGDGTATHPGHGRYSDSKTYLVQTDAEALSRGAWLVNKRSEPTTRLGTLTINLFKMTPAQAQAVVAAVEPGCWLRVTGLPSQTPGSTTVDVVVQSIAPTTNDAEWSIACNVVSRSMFQAWVMGDPTFGVMGSTTILAP